MDGYAGSATDAGRTGERISLAAFEHSTDPPEYRLELAAGQLVREPAPGGRHGAVHTQLVVALRREAGSVAHVLGETGFVLVEDPPTVRRPDVSMVLRDSQPEGVPVGLFHRAPDLAVEIISPSNTASEIQRKVEEYLAAGTRLVWVVYPETRSVVVHEPGGVGRTLGEEAVLKAPDLVPGLQVPVVEVFEE